jgi:hypothetical protein
MHPVSFSCKGSGSFQVFGKCLHKGHDFLSYSNVSHSNFDYLFFFDSRGISSGFKDSLADLIINFINNRQKSFLMVCRPIELTTWATLVGFLRLNKIRPLKIITNMGFVDFTPKKQTILADVLGQVNIIMGHGVASIKFIEHYPSPGGIPLYNLQYNSVYKKAVETIAAQHEVIIINSPVTDTNILIPRRRPKSFYSAVLESNSFNHSIYPAFVIDPPKFDEKHTYDAVHYTPLGNELIFNMLQYCL